MEEKQQDPKPKLFHYAYVYEGLFALVTMGLIAIVGFLKNPIFMFFAWYVMLILGGFVVFFLKRRMERDLRAYFGDEKTRLIYAVCVYWLEGGLFLATVMGTLFFIILRATGKL